ncbi:MAG: YigZ family protein [Oscillospiraceae bacterium]|nr:YigZ family protein [Oscillospiraceae bacterium]
MILEYKTVFGSSEAKFIEKKSKFISNCSGIESELEISDFLKKIKNFHKFAKRNAYAYKIFQDLNLENNEYFINKCSDDGEPNRTAGIQILNSINISELKNVIITVSRYFGGILFGVGGLSRAYRYSSELAISKSKIITKKLCTILNLNIDYIKFDKIQNIINSSFCIVLNKNYTQNVNLEIAVIKNYYKKFLNLISEKIGSEVKPKFLKEAYMNFN